MCVLLKNLMLAVQSINFVCTDFWSPYLVQMGAGIRQSMANVDTDSLLSQNWPPSTLVRHRSCKSCSETESATTDWNGRKKPEKNTRNATEFLNSVDLGKVWPPLAAPASPCCAQDLEEHMWRRSCPWRLMPAVLFWFESDGSLDVLTGLFRVLRSGPKDLR